MKIVIPFYFLLHSQMNSVGEPRQQSAAGNGAVKEFLSFIWNV